MQVSVQPVTIGWVLAVITLVLVVVFAVVGLPDPKALLFLIGLLALARLV